MGGGKQAGIEPLLHNQTLTKVYELFCRADGWASVTLGSMCQSRKDNQKCLLVQYGNANWRALILRWLTKQWHGERGITLKCTHLGVTSVKMEQRWVKVMVQLQLDWPAGPKLHQPGHFHHLLPWNEPWARRQLHSSLLKCKLKNIYQIEFHLTLPWVETLQ